VAYVYLVMTAQIPQREFELVVAPDVAAASKLGIVMLLTGEADDHEVDARLGGPAARPPAGDLGDLSRP
jgi:hypothetical protein